MTRAPLILITPSTQIQGAEFLDSSISLSDRYPAAVVAAGGIPWVMPCLPKSDLIAEYVRRSDGVMLTGGDDLQTGLYRKKVPPKLAKTVGPTAPHRDLAELVVVQEALAQRKPILGICRGMQLLNVALGGTLYVDIESQLPNALRHSHLDKKDKLVQKMVIEDGSLVKKIFGKSEIYVNSTHHQALERIAPGLRVTARGPDGVAETIEMDTSASKLLPFFLGVQFHPERLYQAHPEFLRLFQSFTKASAKKVSPI